VYHPAPVDRLPNLPSRESLARDRGALVWVIVVAGVYLAATYFVARAGSPGIDRAMQLAINLAHGRFDLGPVARFNDIVVIDGRNYQAISVLPIVPYLVFVPFAGLWTASHWIVSAVLGMIAGWLALPLARRYGPGGASSYWLAAFGAFGTLLFTQSISGSFYYLGHVEAILCTFVALLEWRGRRRAWVLGLAFGLAGLARPTVLLAIIPFGFALLLEAGKRVRTLAAFLGPVVATIAITFAYDFARFGSPFETGYGISILSQALAEQRAQGIFSVRHLPYNLGLFIARGFDLQAHFPYLVPDTNGQSILLTSPALLAAVGAPIRDMTVRVLWASTILVAIPVFLYYGGGGPITYGYRYALDFMPFLFTLVAIAVRTRFGALEKLLIVLSCVFVGYGFVWLVHK
jgi:hypothetical protein